MCQTATTTQTASKASTSPQHKDAKVHNFPEGDINAPYNAWLANYDHVGFTREMKALGKRTEKAQGPGE